MVPTTQRGGQARYWGMGNADDGLRRELTHTAVRAPSHWQHPSDYHHHGTSNTPSPHSTIDTRSRAQAQAQALQVRPAPLPAPKEAP